MYSEIKLPFQRICSRKWVQGKFQGQGYDLNQDVAESGLAKFVNLGKIHGKAFLEKMAELGVSAGNVQPCKKG